MLLQAVYSLFTHRLGKPNVALQYLNTVLELETSLNESDISIARTHLNICAIESLLGRHEMALESAEKAVKIAMGLHSDSGKHSELESIGTTLAIAFYNTAIELEHLHKYKEANFACTYGLNLSKQILGPNHPLSSKMSDFAVSMRKHKEIQENQEKAIKLMQVRPSIKRSEDSQLISSPYEKSNTEMKAWCRATKRAASCLKGKFSPRKTLLAKQFALPNIKIPADKYYDYTTSKLKKKEDYSFEQEEAMKTYQFFNKSEDRANDKDLGFLFSKTEKLSHTKRKDRANKISDTKYKEKRKSTRNALSEYKKSYITDTSPINPNSTLASFNPKGILSCNT
eukprot:TRINITY_DN15237_c0_g1_i1.p1 TRINITY_DN15237_c0_g1~~TRINITY_DN15237_c0_g1_i1.p1  ORF type:complete len:340 (+),score=48.18 TRINITY_DN15237_c0_g1_i1:329-1348(+)